MLVPSAGVLPPSPATRPPFQSHTCCPNPHRALLPALKPLPGSSPPQAFYSGSLDFQVPLDGPATPLPPPDTIKAERPPKPKPKAAPKPRPSPQAGEGAAEAPREARVSCLAVMGAAFHCSIRASGACAPGETDVHCSCSVRIARSVGGGGWFAIALWLQCGRDGMVCCQS